MKFRYYITNLFDGVIQGTNDDTRAASYSLSEDFFVVDTETGRWLLSGGSQKEITEIPYINEDDQS